MSSLSQDLLNKLFKYQDGVLYWKVASSNKFKVGDAAGMVDRWGYLRTTINYKPYRNHRLIFLMHHGHLPKIIDHKDGDKLNNKIENLREATPSQNSRNHKLYSTNTSGYSGVYWVARLGKWRARVLINGKRHSLGAFATPKLANEAVLSYVQSIGDGFIREIVY